jgi:type III pantothenate kinase
MANLLIEIGNTALKAACSEGLTLGRTFRYQGEKKTEYILSLVEREKPSVLIISSVYDIQSYDEKLLRQSCPQLILLDPSHSHEFLSDHALPDYLTCDRAAALIAVRHLFPGKGCTLMDFGTTLTVDFISASGDYLGGNISLGCRTRFKALNRYSKVLPLVDTPSEISSRGHSTVSSIESGIISGIMFEIQGYIDSNTDNVTIFTGGDAIYFAKKMKNPIFVVCNLVMMGLAILTDEYVREKIQ